MADPSFVDELADMDADAHPLCASGTCPAPALSAVDLLAVASRAAACAASEQSEAISAAARTLESVARDRGCIWVAGEAADEHARRLNAVGYRARVALDIDRLPPQLGPGDALLLSVANEAPRALLMEARRRRTATIVLAGPSGVESEGGVVIRVRCFDERALELTHGFIVTALCAESPAHPNQTESAA